MTIEDRWRSDAGNSDADVWCSVVADKDLIEEDGDELFLSFGRVVAVYLRSPVVADGDMVRTALVRQVCVCGHYWQKARSQGSNGRHRSGHVVCKGEQSM